MAIKKKLIHFRSKAKFDEYLAANDILDSSIVFIQDEKLIWTHGTFYTTGTSGSLSTEDIVSLKGYTGVELSPTDTLNEALSKIATKLGEKISFEDIVDNLNSTDSSKPLSSNQGKILKDLIDSKTSDSLVTKESIEKVLTGDIASHSHTTVNGHTVLSNVPENAKFTDTVYTHPSFTAKSSGLYKITVNNQGHVSATTEVTKQDITNLGIPAQDTTYSVMKGATSSAGGSSGLVPAPVSGKQTSFLRGDGTWVIPTDTKYNIATSSSNGLMSSSDKSKLDGIDNNANNYSLPTSSATELGGIKVGYTENGKNYPVELDGENKAFVNVPWSNTTYSAATSTTFGTVKIGTAAAKANGTASAGSTTGGLAASVDHVHPLQTSVSGNAGTATKLASPRSIALTGAVTGSANFDGSANISIATTQAADFGKITTITKTLTVTTAWLDTGITGANIPDNGSYIVQISGMSSSATTMYSEIFTGVMSWYKDTTNSSDSDEIILHKAGHSSGGATLYLRTLRVASSGTLKLQIASSRTNTSSTYTFKFRRLI